MPLPLHVSAHGAGPPVVVLHGLFGHGGNWAAIARRLAASHRVLLVDLRNHGASPHHPRMDYPAMAEDVAAVIDAAGGSAAVIGHSMGGKVAMTLALDSPGRVLRLVAVDIAPVAYPPTLRAYAEAMASLPLRPGMRRAEADSALREAIPDPAERGFLLQNLRLDATVPSWRCNLPAIIDAMDAISAAPPAAEAARWEGEALFVAGERSAYVDARGRAAALARFPAAAFVVVPGAGHWVHAEAPEAFLGAVLPFLAGEG